MCHYLCNSRAGSIFERISDHYAIYRRCANNGNRLDVVLDWFGRLCLALCVLWNFHNTFAYLGLYDFGKYSFKSGSALDESTSGNGLGGICRKAEKCIGRPRWNDWTSAGPHDTGMYFKSFAPHCSIHLFGLCWLAYGAIYADYRSNCLCRLCDDDEKL